MTTFLIALAIVSGLVAGLCFLTLRLAKGLGEGYEIMRQDWD